ncbi:putative disease resistance protein [Quercus suber]|uniref:Disease resistance protein n=1 Tax=Quercus suber TaxID=58331 RepID=A0AAW0KSF0_QUESU
MIYPNSNIKNLKDQFQKLGNKRHGVQLEIDAAKRKGEIVATEVQSWVEKVDNISEELQRFLEEDVKANKMCLDGWCPNLKLRSYSLSRNAKKKTLEIDGLLKDGQFAKVSRPPPPGMGSLSIIMDFESRTKTLKEVLEALRDDKINMIAICGMRGIGKTTMAKVVKKRAKDDKLFGEVGIVQTLDLKKIQDQIGEMLGLKFDEKYPLARPKRLKKRLMDSKSVLIILDDVRDALDLEAVWVGQRLFTKIDTVAEARNRFHAILKNLIRSFLLLDSEEGEQFVKMHDVVRDVATSIAENQGILVRYNEKMEEWPEKDLCERSTAISLVSKELKRHPDGLECPKLELLQLHLCGNHTWQTLLPPNLFKGMNGLKVLSMLGMSLPSLPQSIHFFENLRTLELFDCELADVSAIGELSKLEILSIIGSKIKKLPGEIGYLSHLKLLDLTGCFYLERIPAGLLSSLSQLEELYMLGVSHVDWEPMEDNKEEEEEESKRKPC